MKITPPPMPKPKRVALLGEAYLYFTQDQLAARDQAWQELVQPLVEALAECVEDSQSVVDQYIQAYGENFRPARLAAMRKTVSDALAALSNLTKE
jgi:ABC-type nitrate/sulfonate/bicarbonate transport system substrate-binding protein